MNSNSVGALTEGKVMAQLLEAGYTVALPFGVVRYDLILDDGDGLKRVQCKTGRLREGAVRFKAFSVNARAGGTLSRNAYHGEADLFGVYCPDNNEVYLVPVGAHTSEVALRVNAPRNGQQSGVRMASDYRV